MSEDENDNLGVFTVPELSVQLPEVCKQKRRENSNVRALFQISICISRNLFVAQGGPMMTSLAAFLKEMHSAGKAATISPSHLFGQVRTL